MKRGSSRSGSGNGQFLIGPIIGSQLSIALSIQMNGSSVSPSARWIQAKMVRSTESWPAIGPPGPLHVVVCGGVYPKNLRTEDSPMSFGTAKVDEKEYLTSAVLR